MRDRVANARSAGIDTPVINQRTAFWPGASQEIPGGLRRALIAFWEMDPACLRQGLLFLGTSWELSMSRQAICQSGDR